MTDYLSEHDLFTRLRSDANPSWTAYVAHPFVRDLADGSLPGAAFRYYLRQDYLFLIHFARAYALLAFKSERLDDIRAAAATLTALVDTEMRLHVDFCAGWGLNEADMAATPEDTACMAYTRYVLEKGLSGDSLDLLVALAPCVIGYGEIGWRLSAPSGAKAVAGDNPYQAWIDLYGGDDYQPVAIAAARQLDGLFAQRGSAARYPDLLKTFDEACRLEADFWQMGLNAAH